MYKFEQFASRDPHEVLENFLQEQSAYYSSWEEDWSKRVTELARNGGHQECGSAALCPAGREEASSAASRDVSGAKQVV